MGAVVENGTLFHLKKFANFLINLKIIKIIIIKNKKCKNLKKLNGWLALPKGMAGHPIIDQGGGWSHPFGRSGVDEPPQSALGVVWPPPKGQKTKQKKS
jgi:hypothetical protein